MSSTTASQPVAGGESSLGRLEAALGHHFARRELLLEALTHTSYAHEFGAPGVAANERLEFLGDAVLGLIASDVVYRHLPDASEGDLTRLRVALVRASTLATFARDLRLGQYLRLGRGEESTGGRERELLLARTFEALVGALYQDGDIDAARAVLTPLLDEEADRAASGSGVKDDKSHLQELAQARLGITPTYRVVAEEGPSHDRTFCVEVVLGEHAIAQGQGRSKRQAEQAAAHNALADEGWQSETAHT